MTIPLSALAGLAYAGRGAIEIHQSHVKSAKRAIALCRAGLISPEIMMGEIEQNMSVFDLATSGHRALFDRTIERYEARKRVNERQQRVMQQRRSAK